FFQAEDGIRDRNVTGVQTCALPISFLQANFQIILLQKSGIDPAAAAELLVPATTEVTTFGEEALSETEAALESMREVLGMLLPYLNIMILYFLVLFYG